MEMPFSTALPSPHGPLILAFLDPTIATGNDPSVRRVLHALAQLAEKYEIRLQLPTPNTGERVARLL